MWTNMEDEKMPTKAITTKIEKPYIANGNILTKIKYCPITYSLLLA